jgi:hypothetical protein
VRENEKIETHKNKEEEKEGGRQPQQTELT